METIYLLFRNSNNGRIENNMYFENDTPLYVEEIKAGINKGYFVDVLSNRVMSIPKSIIKYACTVNEDLSIKTYYNDDCELVQAPEDTFYTEAINF